VNEIVADSPRTPIEDHVSKHVHQKKRLSRASGTPRAVGRSSAQSSSSTFRWTVGEEEGIADGGIALPSLPARAERALARRLRSWAPDVMSLWSRSRSCLQTLDHSGATPWSCWTPAPGSLFAGLGHREPAQRIQGRKSFNLFEGMSTSLARAVEPLTAHSRRGHDGAGGACEPAYNVGSQICSSNRREDELALARAAAERLVRHGDHSGCRCGAQSERFRQAVARSAQEACPCGSCKKYKHCHRPGSAERDKRTAERNYRRRSRPNLCLIAPLS